MPASSRRVWNSAVNPAGPANAIAPRAATSGSGITATAAARTPLPARADRATDATGYHLTPRGEHLAQALGELMLWGLGLPEMYQPEDQSRAVWLAMNMQAALQRAEECPPAGTYAFHVGEERFWLHVAAHGHTTLRDGTPPYPADVTLIGTLGDLQALATGTRSGDLDATIDGDHARLGRLFELLQIRSPAHPHHETPDDGQISGRTEPRERCLNSSTKLKTSLHSLARRKLKWRRQAC